MIRRPTVIILGAGASCPFGFPTGKGFVDDLREPSGTNLLTPLESRFGHQAVREFVSVLSASGQHSIDRFLDDRRDFLDVGKAAIALRISQFEIPQRVLHRDVVTPGGINEVNWYDVLVNDFLAAPFEGFADNRVTFVTFNYDRSLEYFLMSRLQHRFGRSETEVAEVLSKIPIIHVHGSLGSLPWQNDDTQQPHAYEPINDPIIAQAISERITIVWEEVRDSAPIKYARKAIADAAYVFFIGFGFDERNMEHVKDLLGGNGSYRTASGQEQKVCRSVVGTGCGLTHQDREYLANRYRPLRLSDCTAGQFLHNCHDCLKIRDPL